MQKYMLKTTQNLKKIPKRCKNERAIMIVFRSLNSFFYVKDIEKFNSLTKANFNIIIDIHIYESNFSVQIQIFYA